MKWLNKKWVISCEQAGVLTEKKLDLGLSLSENIKLNFHQKICAFCKNYVTDSQLLDDLLKKEPTVTLKPKHKLPDSAKTQMSELIHRQSGK